MSGPRVALRISRTVFSALSGMRLLACLIVAPQRGYGEPAILSYAISSFCPTSADGLQGSPSAPSFMRRDLAISRISIIISAVAMARRHRRFGNSDSASQIPITNDGIVCCAALCRLMALVSPHCPNLVAIGAKRTCGEREERVDLTKMMLWTAPTLRHQSAIGWLRRNEPLEGSRPWARLARSV